MIRGGSVNDDRGRPQFVLGAMLSLFFKYPVLIMASVAVLIVTGVNGIVDGRSLWFVVLSMVLS